MLILSHQMINAFSLSEIFLLKFSILNAVSLDPLLYLNSYEINWHEKELNYEQHTTTNNLT